MIDAGVRWEFNAWSESTQLGREGKPSMWSTYSFDTEREAVKERDRLERQWKQEKGYGPYKFSVYRVETTEVKRKTKKKK